MKPHASEVAGNLVTSADDGSVWAVWRILPVGQQLAADADRFAHHAALVRLARALHRPALLFSVCQPVTPEALEAALTTGAVASAALDARVDLTVDAHLDGRAIHERTYWLAAQVEGGSGDRWTAQAARATKGAWRSAWRWIDRVDYDDDEVARHLTIEAAELEAAAGLDIIEPGAARVATPGALVAQRARVAEIEWLTARLARRGTDAEVALGEWDSPERQLTRAGMMRLNDCAWSENWVPELTRTSGLRRHVVAEVDEGGPYSFQTSLVLAAQPAELFFPGGRSEWLLRANSAWSREEGVFPVDWFLAVRPRRDRKARKQIDNRLTNAADQPEQTDEGTGVGTKEHVLADIEALTDLASQVTAGEPKLDVVAWFTIAADSYSSMRDRERAFRRLWGDDWKLTRPAGEQLALVRASQPGAELPSTVLRDYKRDQLPVRLAAASPYAGSDVGDPYGALVAVNIGDGLCGPVHLDPGYGIRELNRSGSLVFAGVTGSGKSTAKKVAMEALMVRGSRFVALDPAREYLPLAHHVGGQIIDPADPTASLDPLTMLAAMVRPDVHDRERAIDACIAIIDALSQRGIEAMSPQWAELRRLVEQAADARGRLWDVAAHIIGDTTGPFADMARPLDVAVHLPGLRSVFDPHLLPFRATAPLTVIVLAGHHLPEAGKAAATAQELQSQALMTAAFHGAKEAVYEDPSRYGAVVSDEAREPLGTKYGAAMMHELFDQGRKRHAGGWLSVTDLDAVPERLWDQADTRLFFRLESDRAVNLARGLLGSAGEDPDIAEVLRGSAPGDCVLRDVRHRVSKVHIALPLDPALRAAVDTTPTLDVRPDAERVDAA